MVSCSWFQVLWSRMHLWEIRHVDVGWNATYQEVQKKRLLKKKKCLLIIQRMLCAQNLFLGKFINALCSTGVTFTCQQKRISAKLHDIKHISHKQIWPHCWNVSRQIFWKECWWAKSSSVAPQCMKCSESSCHVCLFLKDSNNFFHLVWILPGV